MTVSGGTTAEPVPDVPPSTAVTDGGAANPMNSREPSEPIPAAGAFNSLVSDQTSSAAAVSAVLNHGSKTSRKPFQPRNDFIHIPYFCVFSFLQFLNPFFKFHITLV